MSAAWRSFGDELARWRDAGRVVEFWWRDDDATRPAPVLERLLALARRSTVPLALAVVPEPLEGAWLSELEPGIALLQHGFDHRNRATGNEKKTEFPAAEPPASALARLATGRRRLATLAGTRALDVLAPPWNRIPAELVPRLPEAGLRGLSGYGARPSARAASGVLQVNTHVDIVAWKAGRGFVGDEAALGLARRHLAARRAGEADPGEPTGLLTHHAVHDEGAWDFLERFFEGTRRDPGVRWRHAKELFAGGSAP